MNRGTGRSDCSLSPVLSEKTAIKTVERTSLAADLRLGLRPLFVRGSGRGRLKVELQHAAAPPAQASEGGQVSRLQTGTRFDIGRCRRHQMRSSSPDSMPIPVGSGTAGQIVDGPRLPLAQLSRSCISIATLDSFRPGLVPASYPSKVRESQISNLPCTALAPKAPFPCSLFFFPDFSGRPPRGFRAPEVGAQRGSTAQVRDPKTLYHPAESCLCNRNGVNNRA